MPRHEKELRCFCKFQPLLATYGVDSKGVLFVHVKVYKAKRIFAELIVVGDVKIRCRDCLRWHKIRVYQREAALQETHEELPVAVVQDRTVLVAPYHDP